MVSTIVAEDLVECRNAEAPLLRCNGPMNCWSLGSTLHFCAWVLDTVVGTNTVSPGWFNIPYARVFAKPYVEYRFCKLSSRGVEQQSKRPYDLVAPATSSSM